ncbi:dCTP deaminase [Vibrio campbellii]|uniref:dCTP deaminase n=1 Tax=Vibrio campbellii (strain ATCC BAA-1116) TaxID=2902295 RepID=A7N2D7_VIBC1|nr:dCTP deaminase [Vibrio campbellii]ABU73960.1 hypothetical protein VIBHAR_06067 [Vibrio campbellii ATCC BAA-1116]AGU98467.1 hypothetical protein M892_21570 [Vibrio campbellii ATCC BAA-1116]MBT0124171.1 dCTP deaminase [Vibrio campbellii]MBT0139103.1 dCTP deaminase [Vibrio campbellii]MBT0143803.1 dCTP deaminase [Vibrio campbellii]
MILTGKKISQEAENGNIILDPYADLRVTSNSYDLALGKKYIVYDDEIIDPFKKANFQMHTMPEEGIYLNKGDFILCESAERVGSEHYVPIIHAKSGIARAGLFVHVTADLIDIGSIGKITFQLYATLPVKIVPGMLIGQVSFWVPDGDVELYNGKYQGSEGPMVSKTYLDYV